MTGGLGDRQVSVFLAAFSGLYFTVYAVSDATYREQFFTRISRDLERTIGVRAVYESVPTAVPKPMPESMAEPCPRATGESGKANPRGWCRFVHDHERGVTIRL